MNGSGATHGKAGGRVVKNVTGYDLASFRQAPMGRFPSSLRGLTHHLGMGGHDYARKNILAWSREMENGGRDAIVINASGCGTTVKDYGFMFRDDTELADKARRISEMEAAPT